MERAEYNGDIRIPHIPGGSLDQIARREWLTHLRYGYTEAHLAATSSHGATLDFVTQIAPGGLYVTGQVEVQMPEHGRP